MSLFKKMRTPSSENIYIYNRFSILTQNLTYMQMRICGKERGISNEGKKKRYEENPEAIVKKSKTESSTASSAKVTLIIYYVF